MSFLSLFVLSVLFRFSADFLLISFFCLAISFAIFASVIFFQENSTGYVKKHTFVQYLRSPNGLTPLMRVFQLSANDPFLVCFKATSSVFSCVLYNINIVRDFLLLFSSCLHWIASRTHISRNYSCVHWRNTAPYNRYTKSSWHTHQGALAVFIDYPKPLHTFSAFCQWSVLERHSHAQFLITTTLKSMPLSKQPQEMLSLRFVHNLLQMIITQLKPVWSLKEKT